MGQSELVAVVRYFFLGIPPSFLNCRDPRLDGVPVLIAQQRLPKAGLKSPVQGPWALDSGGFNELRKHGRWRMSTGEYTSKVIQLVNQAGRRPEWIAPMDWMVEKDALLATGLSIKEHIRLSVDYFIDLANNAPSYPWIPVLQGNTVEHYWDSARQYYARGVALERFPCVGLGSVCRRGDVKPVLDLIRELYAKGIRVHAFGFKKTGLRAVGQELWSADSEAWSYEARRKPRLEGCTHVYGPRVKDKSKIGTPSPCNNCLTYALKWRAELIQEVAKAPAPRPFEVTHFPERAAAWWRDPAFMVRATREAMADPDKEVVELPDAGFSWDFGPMKRQIAAAEAYRKKLTRLRRHRKQLMGMIGDPDVSRAQVKIMGKALKRLSADLVKLKRDYDALGIPVPFIREDPRQ